MNLVSFALRRPISLLTMVIAVALVGFLAVDRMSRDIFPDLGVPTIYVAQPYGGLDPAQMEGFIVNYYEYHFLYITGIEHVESKSIQGIGLIKLQFHPGTDMAQALAETIAQVNRARAFMPPGTVPPFVMRFDAGSVPVGNLVFSSETRTVGQLQDAALNLVRPLFATVPIRVGVYPTIFVRDVAEVADASDIVTSYALVNGRRTVYIPVTKRSDASTLSVVNLVKQNLPKFQNVVPADVKVSYEFDQSPYVIRAIAGLTLEGGLGAVLTGLMVLLFLRDWRSALIVVINIPLSLMSAVIALWMTRQTVNIMTLGGLALAIGILVDE